MISHLTAKFLGQDVETPTAANAAWEHFVGTLIYEPEDKEHLRQLWFAKYELVQQVEANRRAQQDLRHLPTKERLGSGEMLVTEAEELRTQLAQADAALKAAVQPSERAVADMQERLHGLAMQDEAFIEQITNAALALQEAIADWESHIAEKRPLIAVLHQYKASTSGRGSIIPLDPALLLGMDKEGPAALIRRLKRHLEGDYWAARSLPARRTPDYDAHFRKRGME